MSIFGGSMNKKRILCLGDSATAGYPYEEKPAHTYPAQLQRWLGRTSKDFEVVNAGVDGLTALQLEAMLSELLETHQPDIVVLMIGGNDMLQHLYANIGRPRPKLALGAFRRVQRLANRIKSFQTKEGNTPKLIVSGYYAISFMLPDIAAFNALLPGMLNVDCVTLANLGAFVNLGKAQVRREFLYDLAHPNRLGYLVIAKNLAEAVLAL